LTARPAAAIIGDVGIPLAARGIGVWALWSAAARSLGISMAARFAEMVARHRSQCHSRCGGVRLKRGRDFGGGGRYRNPQAWIDHVVETEPALSHVELSYPPRYSGRLKSYGMATLEEPGVRGSTSIGRPSLVSRRELLDTIIHEETHHRLWRRAQAGSARAWTKVADPVVEEAYVEDVAYRFVRLQDDLKALGRK
jgi:hypothetical protein